MSDYLEPCPFCGESASLANNRGVVYVHCQFCGAQGPDLGGGEADAASSWNAAIRPTIEAVKALESCAAILPRYGMAGKNTGEDEELYAVLERVEEALASQATPSLSGRAR